MKENFKSNAKFIFLRRHALIISAAASSLIFLGILLSYRMSNDYFYEETVKANLSLAKSSGRLVQRLTEETNPRENAEQLLTIWKNTLPGDQNIKVQFIKREDVQTKKSLALQNISWIQNGTDKKNAENLIAAAVNRSEWTGITVQEDQKLHISAYAYLGIVDGLIGIHTPKKIVEQKAWNVLAPWWMGLGLIGLILVPGTALLIYKTNVSYSTKLNSDLLNARHELKTCESTLATNEVGIWQWHQQEGKIYVNSIIAGWLGIPEQDGFITLENWQRSFSEHFDDLKRAIIKHINEDSNYFSCELSLRMKRGMGWVLCQGRVNTLDNHGHMATLSGVLLNISNEMGHQQELKRVNKELEGFLYKSTHNLKGPVASIKGLMMLIRKNLVGNDLAMEYLGLMEKSTYKLEKTLEELLDLAKVKQGRLEVQKVELQNTIKSQIEAIKFSKGFDEMEIFIELEESIPLYSDLALIESILHNLIENAFKYRSNDTKPYIKITGSVSNEIAEIKVIDNGKGIPKSMRSMVFDMFYRASPDTKGSGLGLYIVNNAIKRLKGKIQLDSEVKKGSVFTIIIPNHKMGFAMEEKSIILHKN